MDVLSTHAEYLGHVRTIVGMILGLSLARLVNGFTRFIQHPGTVKVHPVHIGWALFLLISIVHFWWYEFHLTRVAVWTFPLYGFLIFYTMVFAALTSLIFPDQMNDYKGFKDYFESRKRWFFGLLAFSFVMDFGDTAIKGFDYFEALGPTYLIHQLIFISVSVAAAFLKSQKAQLTLVAFAISYQIFWIISVYDIL